MGAVKTNDLGTDNVLNAAVAKGVDRVIALSTARAVCPNNAMGMSRQDSLENCASDVDMLAQQMQRALEDSSLRREMKSKALTLAKEFSLEKCADDTYAALTHWAG